MSIVGILSAAYATLKNSKIVVALLNWLKKDGVNTAIGWGASFLADRVVDSVTESLEPEKYDPITHSIQLRDRIADFESKNADAYEEYCTNLNNFNESIKSNNSQILGLSKLPAYVLPLLANYTQTPQWDGSASSYIEIYDILSEKIKDEVQPDILKAWNLFDSLTENPEINKRLAHSLIYQNNMSDYIKKHSDTFGAYEKDISTLESLYNQFPYLMQATENLTSDSQSPVFQAVLGAIEGVLTQLDTEVVGIVETNTSLIDSITTLTGTNDDLQLLHTNLNAAIQNIPTTIATMAPIYPVCSCGGFTQPATTNPEAVVDDFITGVQQAINGMEVSLDGKTIGNYVDRHIARGVSSRMFGRTSIR